MGVPKFFRYISERYPCLSELVKEYQIPDFDNLYLDMNGIIHMCSHPDDGDPHFRITEERIFADIFHYIEVLYRMIRPRKLFFMAIDGVAPRAKMNQQRARRFRSAKDAEKLEEKARKKGEVLPNEARFDSNCITPGTVFMARLHEQLKYFVTNKISTDKLWQNCKIILSGHETPGEGEHKIMDYIRYMRAQPDHDPNTRHCLYGLDADLIMLGLCTHEPHFSLLREEVKFGKKSTAKRKASPEEITFYLLHLSLMREYLELEFDKIKQNKDLRFQFDIENIIDDWVLMGFLVGNDFIPHLPNLHINNGALPILYDTYMNVLPTFDGYINEGGTLHLGRFEKFMEELSKIDMENFSDTYADIKYFEDKTGRRPNDRQRKSYKNDPAEQCNDENEDLIDLEFEEAAPKPKSELELLIDSTNEMFDNDEGEDSSSEDDNMRKEFSLHKKDYYNNKLGCMSAPEDMRLQAEGYVRAIQWNLHYYYNGVCSWSWFYPHHYSPYISDIRGFADFKLEFDFGKPFQPYEQLLAVLPAASMSLLPEPYHHLMTDDSSIIKKYYPEDFMTDLNGKKADWEAVVLIPFIDEDKLLKAMAPCNELLTPEEIERNTHGPMLIYTYSQNNLGSYSAPDYFPPVKNNYATCQPLLITDIRVPRDKLVKGAYPGVKLDVYFPGFPTLKHLKYSHKIEKAAVRVHEQPSRGESVILYVKNDEEDTESKESTLLDAVARELLGRTIHVAWPHLVEALVVMVSDKHYRYNGTGEPGHYNVEEAKGNLAQLWHAERKSISEHYRTRFGIDVGETSILINVKVMVGRKYTFTPQGRVTLDKQWAQITSAYPLHMVVKNLNAYCEQYTTYKDVESVFPVGSYCFMLGHPHYGSIGEVRDSKESLKKGRVKVNMKTTEEPDLEAIKEFNKDIRIRYMDLHAASTRLSISRYLFTRITGSIFVSLLPRFNNSEDTNKVNIGLNLKFTKRNEEIPGYTHRDEDGIWRYSEKAVNLVKAYRDFCPTLFDYLNINKDNDHFADEIFLAQDSKKKIEELTEWIQNQPYHSIERQACGSTVLEPDVVKKLEEFIDEYNEKRITKDVLMQVKPHLLYKPNLNMGNICPDPTMTVELYDRVINVRESYTVPYGLRGTVIAVHRNPKDKESEPLYDILFDEAFPGGLSLNCSPNRAYRLLKPGLINKSHGQRQLEQKAGKSGQLIQSLQANMQQNPSKNFAGAPIYFNYQNSAFATWGNQNSTRPVLQQNPNVNYKLPQNVNAYGNQYAGNNSQRNVYQPMYMPANQQVRPQQIPTNFMPNYAKSEPTANYEKNDQQKFYQNNKLGSSPQRQSNVKPGAKGPAQNKEVKQEANWRQGRESTSAERTTRVNTDFLKQMLNLNMNSDKQKRKQPEPAKTEEKKLTVQDIFTHARANSLSTSEAQVANVPKNTYSSVQLLSYYQANGLGCPHYSYFDMLDKTVQAQLINPINGNIICGEPSPNKSEACESVASKLLNILHENEKVPVSKPIPASPCIPAPPKEWCQLEENNAPAKSPPKNNKPGPITNTSNSRKNADLSKENPNPEAKASGSSEAKASGSSETKPLSSSIVNSSSFIPLQAVRQHITKSSLSTNKKSSSKENETAKTESTNVTETSENVLPQNSIVKPAGDAKNRPQKPRRKRKMRIAANFQVNPDTKT